MKFFIDGANWCTNLYVWDSGAQGTMVESDCYTPYAWDSRVLPFLVF